MLLNVHEMNERPFDEQSDEFRTILDAFKKHGFERRLHFRVRPAVVDDARIIAEIHYAGWQLAYSSISSADQMAAKLPERRYE